MSDDTADPEGQRSPAPRRERRPGALVLVAALFFAFGFLTSLNGVLVPHFMKVFELGYTGASLVQLAFFSAYLVLSLPSGKLVASVGYHRGIALGLVAMGAGALMFYPAASLPSYPFFLAGLFVLASGITLLQVAANPYVTVLGPAKTASSRLNLVQAFNALGTTLAPAAGGLWILTRQAYPTRLAEAEAVRAPYLGLPVALLALAAVVALYPLPGIAGDAGTGSFRDALRVRRLRLGMAAIFVYTGAEVAIGSFLVSFLELPSIAGLSAADAARCVSYYWGAAMIGRFAGSALLRKWEGGAALAVAASAAAALVVVAVLSSGGVAMWALIAVGLCNSIMFPTIFALGIEGLGDLTSRGSSLLCTAIVGGAIVPLLVGAAADRAGIHHAFALLVICYLYVLYYGARGARRRE
jgi:MFS transporter, FHS family, L-fucose permease